MQANVAIGLTSLKNQIQASGAERRKLVPRMHQKSPFGDPNSKNFSGEGARAYGPRTRRLRRLVLSVPLPLILQFDHCFRGMTMQAYIP